MQRIQAALRDGDPERALQLSAQHAQRWPRGTFVQEREAVSALASCQLDRADALRRARSFLASYPHSALAPRVHRECHQLSRWTRGAPLMADAVLEGLCDAFARQYGPYPVRRRSALPWLRGVFEVWRGRKGQGKGANGRAAAVR